MDPATVLAFGLTSLGYGAVVPAALAVVGAASAVATVYPQSWPGAATVHTLALLFGRASPAVPAKSVVETATSANNYTNK